MRGLLAKLRYLRLTPFDESSNEGRRQERYRRAALTVVASTLSRAIAMLVLFVSLRIALPYLGQARFGVWIMISSLSAVLTVFDFGIGNGLISRIAQAVATANSSLLRRLIGSGLGLLSLIGVVMGGGLALAATFAPLQWLFKGAMPSLIDEARHALILFGILFGFSIPLQAAHRIYAGLQEGYVASIVAALTGLISLCLLPLLPGLHAGICIFLLCTYGIQVFSGIPLVLMLRRRFVLLAIPASTEPLSRDFAGLLRSGGLFFALQIAGVIGWNMDATLLSAFVGPAAVASYSVVQRMFMLVTVPLSLLNAPFWAGYADAHARNDIDFIRSTFKRSIAGTFFLALSGVALLIAVSDFLLGLLTHHSLHVPIDFLIVFGAWTVIDATGNAFGMYLNGVNILKPQVVTCIMFVVLTLFFKLILVERYQMIGLIVASLICYVATTALVYGLIYRRHVSSPMSTRTGDKRVLQSSAHV